MIERVGTIAAFLAAMIAAMPGLAFVSPSAAGEETDRAPVPVRMLLARLPADLDAWNPEGMEAAIAAQLFPMAGREDLVERFDPNAFRYSTCPALAGTARGEALPGDDTLDAGALDAVVARAREAQIVIVNEAHDQPLHREVVRRIGVDLSDMFEFLAAETFEHDALENREAGRIPDDLGSYSDEPIFGRELRALDRAGYSFAAYEIRQDQQGPNAASTAEQVVTREDAQAENFISGILAEDPAVRVLVHVGYSHALEVPVENWGQEIAWFAARLKDSTGIDPLTVSQTHCSLESNDSSSALDGMRLADATDVLERPGAIDLVIAHPPIRFEQNRPVWRRAIGDRDVDLPDSFRGHPGRIIIEARAPGEALDEVPIERLLLYPGESIPLLLPPGNWRLTAWNADGTAADPVDVVVADSGNR